MTAWLQLSIKPVCENTRQDVVIPEVSIIASPLWFVLLAGCDNVVILWNVARGEAVVRIDSIHTDLIYSACWNRDGSRILTSCKDKTMRVLDPRKGTVLLVGFNVILPSVSLKVVCSVAANHCFQEFFISKVTLMLVY